MMRIFEIPGIFKKSNNAKKILKELKTINLNLECLNTLSFDVHETSGKLRELVSVESEIKDDFALFIKVQETFMENMTKYYQLELESLSKRLGEPRPEPTEHDKVF